MRTMQRLDEAYDEAHIVEFDSSSKFVIMSDSHRGDGSSADEFTKNAHICLAALRHYLDEGYVLIEAGDNDELWEFPKFRHITKAYPLTFELLKKFHRKGRYLRLFGNHDMHLATPKYVKKHLHKTRNYLTGKKEALFRGLVVHEGILLRHRESGQEILTVHGHQGDFANDQAWRWSMFMLRIFWRHLHALGFRSPSSPVRNSFKRHKVERNFVGWIRNRGVALICGHTHRERFPREDDAAYFNSGSCVFPNYITCLEIVNDTIAMVNWRMVPDANGYLKVTKGYLAGPKPLADFHISPDPGKHKRPEKNLDWATLDPDIDTASDTSGGPASGVGGQITRLVQRFR